MFDSNEDKIRFINKQRQFMDKFHVVSDFTKGELIAILSSLDADLELYDGLLPKSKDRDIYYNYVKNLSDKIEKILEGKY